MLDYPIRHILVRHEQGAAHMADGYARASGNVGVAVATSGPGATNLVTGIATAMLDSSPIVCITGQVGSKLVGSDAFQETDVTGVTLPITKHNYLVTHVKDVAPTIHEAMYVARSGRPGPVLVDITKDAQQASTELRWGPSDVKLPGYRPDLRATEEEYRRAADLVNGSKRPIIFAGHGVLLSDAMGLVRQLAERANIPVAMTLLGIGGFPAQHPLNLGMMGMHGEAWVNQAIQEADLLLALGMRFDDRVTGNVKTYAPSARKVHVDIDPAEFNKNVKVDVALAGDLAAVLAELCPLIEEGDRQSWLDTISDLKGEVAGSRHPEPAGQWTPVRRARDQRHLAADGREGDRRHRRRPAPDVGGAVLPPQRATVADHVWRARHDGICAALRPSGPSWHVPMPKSGSWLATVGFR